MTKPRLKRCPFDGGKAEYATEKTTYSDATSVRHEINCTTCAANMSVHDYRVGGIDSKQEAADRSELVKKWNARK